MSPPLPKPGGTEDSGPPPYGFQGTAELDTYPGEQPETRAWLLGQAPALRRAGQLHHVTNRRCPIPVGGWECGWERGWDHGWERGLHTGRAKCVRKERSGREGSVTQEAQAPKCCAATWAAIREVPALGPLSGMFSPTTTTHTTHTRSRLKGKAVSQVFLCEELGTRNKRGPSSPGDAMAWGFPLGHVLSIETLDAGGVDTH